MRDCDTLLRRLSLAGRKPRFSPWDVPGIQSKAAVITTSACKPGSTSTVIGYNIQLNKLALTK